MRVDSIFSSNSQKKNKYAYFPKCQSIPLNRQMGLDVQYVVDVRSKVVVDVGIKMEIGERSFTLTMLTLFTHKVKRQLINIMW